MTRRTLERMWLAVQAGRSLESRGWEVLGCTVTELEVRPVIVARRTNESEQIVAFPMRDADGRLIAPFMDCLIEWKET